MEQSEPVFSVMTYVTLGILHAHDAIMKIVQIVECCLRRYRIDEHEALTIFDVQVSHGRELFLE